MADQNFDTLLKNILQINAQLNITTGILKDLEVSLSKVPTNSGLSNFINQLKQDVAKLTEIKSKATLQGVSSIIPPQTGANIQSQGAREKVIQEFNKTLDAYRKDIDNAVKRIQQPLSPGLVRAAQPHIETPYDRLTRKRREDATFFSRPGSEQGLRPGESKVGGGFPGTDSNALSDKYNDVLKREIALKEQAIARQRDFYTKHLASLKESIRQLPKGSGEEETFLRQAYINTLKDKIKFEGTVSEPAKDSGKTDEEIKKEKQEQLKNAQDRTKKEREWLARMTAEQRSEHYYNKYEERTNAEGRPDESRAEKQERERQQVLQEQIAAHKKYTNALKVAAEKGFGIQDLKNVYNRGTDIDRLQFSKKDDYGVKQNLDLYTNSAGKVTPGISNQFRTFGQGVVRDIGELTKWSIALAAVYGPLNKLKELVQEMIANQTKLADASIAVNSSFLSQGQIFDIAAEAANASGEAVGGVIDAFTQAYRAAGGGADQVERLATAQSLLTASLTLSKLSTLDQAQSIDTLAASIRQTGGDFTKTTELLDSWVRVTKVANVDLATLATGFATLGDAAETAGLDANELNGLLAVIAESSNSTGQEVANAARAIVGGLQSDKGVQALETLGIATKTTSGEMRSLQDILIEVNGLIESGVISQTQLSSLGSDIGGGVRRGAIVTTVLSNYNRALQVSEESSKANGDAEAALAKQLETVATALAKLNNAFSSLAQTMGTEGGFLGIITKSVEGITFLVKSFDGLTGVLGKATPALLAFIAASLLLKSRGTSSIQAALGTYSAGGASLDDRLNSIGAIPRAGPGAPGLAASKSRMPFAGNFLGSSGAGSALTQGVGVALIPALQNFFNKDDKFGKIKAGGDLLGGVAGGLIGSITPLGPILGAMIGTAIAETFINSTVDYLTDPAAYTKKPKLGESFAPKLNESGDSAAQKEVEAGLYKSIGGGDEAWGKILTRDAQVVAQTLIDNVNEAIKNQDQSALDEAFRVTSNLAGNRLMQEAGFTPELAQQAFNAKDENGVQTGKPIEASPEIIVYNMADKVAQAAYDSVEAAINAKDTTESSLTPFNQLVNQTKRDYGDIVNIIKESSTDRLQEQRLSGDVKGVEYARQTKALGGSDTKALQYYTALGEEFINVHNGVDDATEAFEAFNDIIVTGVAESIPEITAIVGEITTLTNLLDNVDKNKDRIIELYGSIEAAREKLPELRATGASALSDVYDQSRLSKLSIPNIQGDINKPLLGSEEALVEQRTAQLQDQFYKGFLKLPDDMYQAVKDGFDVFAVPVKEFENSVTNFKSITETDAQMRQAAIAQLAEEGKLLSQQTNPFGIQQLDMTSQEAAGLQGQIDYFSQYLNNNFQNEQGQPLYEQNPEEFGVIFSDYVTDVLHGDNLAVQLALQQLNDKAQKQLDGQYNIPEGATFWVPLTAAYYRPKENGTGAGMEGLDENTSATGSNTQALLELSQAMSIYHASERTYVPYDTRENKNERPPDAFVHRYKQIEEGAALQEGMDIYHASERDRGDTLNSDAGDKSIFEGKYGRDYATPIGSIIESLKQALSSMFSQPTGGFHGYEDNTGLGGQNNAGSGKGIPSRMPDTNINQAQSTKLDIKFESTTQLMVDGRILATIIKPHLAADLLKLEGSQGTITKRYVI